MTQEEQLEQEEMDILTSILAREEFPQKVFNYRGARSTIQPKTVNGVVVR